MEILVIMVCERQTHVRLEVISTVPRRSALAHAIVKCVFCALVLLYPPNNLI